MCGLQRLSFTCGLTSFQLLLDSDQLGPDEVIRISLPSLHPIIFRTVTHCCVKLNFLILIKYCVILVILCLHLCVMKFGQ